MRESKGVKPRRRNESDLGDTESLDKVATYTDIDPRAIGLSGSVSVRTRKVANYARIE